MNDDVILITVPNRYNNYVNIGNPRIAPLYEYYRRRVKCARWPISDKQRFMFEKIIVNLCRAGQIRVKGWVINHDRINAWNLPRWLEYSSDGIPIDNEREILYGSVRDELTLIDRLLFCRIDEYTPTSGDYDVLERIELADPALASRLTDILERRLEA